MDTIRNPAQWAVDQFRHVAHHVGLWRRSLQDVRPSEHRAPLAVRRIAITDLREVLARGVDDFGAYRTDVIFICLVYPVAGLMIMWFAFNYDMLPLVFPLASGFALIGPAVALGLYEMSRRREQGYRATWLDAFGVIRSPSFGAMVVLAFVLLGIFMLWLAVAHLIYVVTMGPAPPVSLSGFAREIFTSAAGWTMIIVGMGVGFLFALLVLAISVVSFPLLLDRDVGLGVAVLTSVRVVLTNPVPMACWGLIVAGGLMLGSLPALLGLIIVMPTLGHATWHLYRKVIAV